MKEYNKYKFPASYLQVQKSSMSKLKLMYSMPVAEFFCEKNHMKFIFYHEHYNVINRKTLKPYTDYLLWDCTLLFSLWFYIIQNQM